MKITTAAGTQYAAGSRRRRYGDTISPKLTSAVAIGDAVAFVPTSYLPGYTSGSTVWVAAKSVVIDPAGNTIDTSNNNNIKSGIGQ